MSGMTRLEQLKANEETFRSKAKCSLVITFTADKLLDGRSEETQRALRRDGIPWQVWQGGGVPIWESGPGNHLEVNIVGVATGRAEVLVKHLLKTVIDTGKTRTVEELYVMTRDNPESPEVEELYEHFTIKVNLGNNGWIELPIDMCIHGC
jgi:hypothetical protein